MDIKDVKVGMLVQLNDNSSKQGCVGEVESIDYLDGLVMLRLEGVVTDSVHNEGNIHNRWRIYAGGFEHYQDPEADMIVWDALCIGEHFYVPSNPPIYYLREAVKTSTTEYVVLCETCIRTIHNKHAKVRLFK